MEYDIETILTMYEDDYNPSSMVPEPRRTGFSNGGSYDYGSMQYKIDSVKAAYRRYKKGSATGGRGGKMTFEQFAPLFAKENFAEGGQAGQLVRNTIDGSRPGYGGPGSGAKSGVSKPVGPGTARPEFVSPMKDARVAAKVAEKQKLRFQESEFGKRIQWIANNGKNYSDPEKFKTAYEKHFKHKIGSKKDVLFNFDKGAPGLKKGTDNVKLINYRQVDNMTFPGSKSVQPLSTITKGFSEDELFKASIIQNNPEIKKQFKTLFKDIHKNVSVYSELGPEGIVEKLNKGKLLNDFDFIKSTVIGNREIGGVHSGIVRASLLNAVGVPTEHLTSYQSVRKPLMAVSQIIENLKNPSKAKEFGISPTTATKIRGQLENFLEGEKNLRADIKKINTQIGDVKFNNIFGGVNFEHTLAKQFGKDYKYLPRNYLLKGQFTSKAFNMMKKDAFDLPLIKLMKQYEQGKVSGAKVQAFIDDFNAKTNNYADFKFDVDKGKLGYISDSVNYDLTRYNDPNVARQELIDNIKLTQSKTFQTGMSKTLPDSKNQLKLFRSKQGKEMLALLEKLGCGQAAGGRILFSNGTPGATMTECAFEGKKKLNKGMSVGFDKTEGDLAKKILQAGRGLGNIFALKNLLGPAAVGFTVAAEAGLIGYDMLSSGKSFREAVGNNLFNYALGDKTRIDSDEERYKRYASLGYDADKIRNYEKTMDRFNEISSQYDDLYGKANAVNIGGPRRSDAIKQKQQIISDKALAEIPAFSQDLFRTGEIANIEKFLKNNFASGAQEIQRADQEALIQQKESGGPKFMGMVFPKFEEGRQQDILNAQGILGYKPPSGTLSNIMSNLSEGGIASLNVNKK